MSFPRYPSYKESGVEWLGEVPAHWEIRKFRYLFRESPEKIESDVIGPMLSVSGYRGVEVKEYDDENRRRLDEDLVGYRVVRVGQLVVNTMWLNYAGLGVSAFEGHVSPAYRSYWIEDGLDRRYTHHLLRSGIYVQGYTQLLTGVRPNSLQMSREDLMSFPVLLPPRDDQSRIAEFLDRETEKIDELVAEQRRLMALLKEKRQAVISHTVTRGLNPAAPLKPSGIQWLGDVPVHWEVMTLRRCATYVQTGGTPSSELPSADLEEGLVWFTPGDFGNDLRLTASTRKISPAAVASGEAKVFPPRSVLVVSIGATLGKVGFAEEASSANQQINAVIPNGRIDGYFLAYSLLVKAEVMRFLSNASTIGIMNQEKTKDIWIAVPPPAEQAAIAAFLDTELAQLDALNAEAQRAIDLLQERRTALISAAVTGQIDVRGAGSTPFIP